MADIIIFLVILLILGISITKIIMEKQRGVKCIGCPLSEQQNTKKNCGYKEIDKKINF